MKKTIITKIIIKVAMILITLYAHLSTQAQQIQIQDTSVQSKQIQIQDTSVQSKQIQIQDTSVQSNIKITLAKSYLQRLENEYIKLFDKEKVEKGEVEFAAETKQLMQYFWKGFNKYTEQFEKADTLTYEKKEMEPYDLSTGQTVNFEYYKDGQGLIAEWDSLNKRIETLKNDEEIEYLEAVKGFRKIKERQELLKKRFDRLRKNE